MWLKVNVTTTNKNKNNTLNEEKYKPVSSMGVVIANLTINMYDEHGSEKRKRESVRVLLAIFTLYQPTVTSLSSKYDTRVSN